MSKQLNNLPNDIQNLIKDYLMPTRIQIERNMKFVINDIGLIGDVFKESITAGTVIRFLNVGIPTLTRQTHSTGHYTNY